MQDLDIVEILYQKVNLKNLSIQPCHLYQLDGIYYQLELRKLLVLQKKMQPNLVAWHLKR